MEAQSSIDFVDKALKICRTLDPDSEEVFQGRELMLEQHWTLAIAEERSYF